MVGRDYANGAMVATIKGIDFRCRIRRLVQKNVQIILIILVVLPIVGIGLNFLWGPHGILIR